MNDELLDFTGQVILITGRSTGIGRATALAFAKRGAKVVVGDVSEEGQTTIELIKAAGGEGLYVKTNVADATQVRALVDTTVKTYGGLHCAFNNAGILRQGRVPVPEISDRTYVEGGRRRHRQYRIGRWRYCRSWNGTLCRGETRRYRFDQSCSGRLRQVRDPGQRTGSRLSRDAHDPTLVSRPRYARRGVSRAADGTSW